MNRKDEQKNKEESSMKRKGLALLLTFCMLAAGAAGCGQTVADSSGAASNAPEQAQEESKQGGGEV